MPICAAQIARSAPLGSLVGFALHPTEFGAVPRTKTNVRPSAEIRSPVRSVPSSFRNDVTRVTRKSGAAAVNTLRFPSSYDSHATRSVFAADTSSYGNPGFRNC